MKTIILLLLMTSVSFADSKLDLLKIDYESIASSSFTPPMFNGVYKISCPDGYHLEGKMFDRFKDRECKHFIQVGDCANKPSNYGIFACEDILVQKCADLPVATDAELKCVKEN